MLKIRKILFLFIFSSLALANSAKRQKILSIINEEIQEVTRLSRQYKNENPSLLFRKAELFLEKGRIVKEGENEKFLSLNADTRAKVQKNNYFKSSRVHFIEARNVALNLLKKFPDYKRSADVYYIIGFNEKELGSYDKAFNYLKKGEAKAKPGSKAKMRIDNALAEMYYNKSNYKSAIQYYERNIKNESDKWWTKDAYNLAWSYFRERRYNQAINLMNKIEAKSSSSKYIDMRSQVKRDIGLFYAEAGKITDGVKHYKKYNQSYVLELLKISKFLEDAGKYAQSMTVLNEALKISKVPKNKAKIYLARMELFDKYEKTNYHLKDAVALYKLTKTYKLSPTQNKLFKYQVERQIGKLQKQVGDKTYQKSKKVIAKKVKQVASYLTLLKGLEPSKAKESYFYVAETYYQASDFEKATNSYLKAYELAKKDKNIQIQKRSVEGMLSAIGQPQSKFPNREKYYQKVYGLYLQGDSRSAKAQKIYQSLYKLALDKKNTKEMESLLATYSSKFPRDVNNQEKMINSLVNVYSSTKNTAALNSVLAKVRTGSYKMSAKGKTNLSGLSEKLEVKKVEQALKRGKYSEAQSGYLSIYNNKSNSKLSRNNAAYNLMALNYKMNRPAETYSWAVRAITGMSNSDFTKNRKTFVSISNFLSENLQYEGSADISHRSFGKLCSSVTNLKKIFFENAVSMYLISNKVSKVNELQRHAKTCRVDSKTISNLNQELLRYYQDNRNYTALEALVGKLDSDANMYPYLFKPAYLLYTYYQTNLMNHKLKPWVRKISKYYRGVLDKNKIPKEGLDVYAWTQIGVLNNEIKKVNSLRLKFPEETFNTILERKIKQLQSLTDKAASIQKIGSGLGIVTSYEKLIEGYSLLRNEVKQFVPPGKSATYVKSFKASMRDIVIPLSQKELELKRQAVSSIKKNQILEKYDSNSENIMFNYFDNKRFFDAERRGR